MHILIIHRCYRVLTYVRVRVCVYVYIQLARGFFFLERIRTLSRFTRALSLVRVADSSFGFYFFAASVPARALSLSLRKSELRILLSSSTLDILVPEPQS
jgi:hypothetical protein